MGLSFLNKKPWHPGSFAVISLNILNFIKKLLEHRESMDRRAETKRS